jgi:uncharacterized membrane protein
MSLESNRTLGGVGAILFAIPFLNLIGIILVLVAMRGMAEYYEDDDIFNNALYGFIFGVVGVVALVAVIFMLVMGAGLGLLLIALVVLYIFSLLAAIFYRNSLNILSEKSGENMFDTAGLILLIGAIIPLIGEILKFVAWILVAVGFFSVKTSTQVFAPSPAVSTPEGKKFCQYCGAQLQVNAAFCQKCGKEIG